MRLCANMMVYNEMPFLDYVIERLLAFCDAVIVMDNGSTDGSREWLRQLGDRNDQVFVIFNQQTIPPHYAKLRNVMLKTVPEGAWVLKWDPDELPSDKMVSDLRGVLEAQQEYDGWYVPIWHLMKSAHTCLPMEIGYAHLRLFRKMPGVWWGGRIHERVAVAGPCGRFSAESGIAVVHFSYFAENRLRRKARHYAAIQGSGFTAQPEKLTDRLNLDPVLLSEQVVFQAPDAWLERIREVE